MRLIKKPEVMGRRGVGASKLHQEIREEIFPPPIKDGRSSLWVDSEVEQTVRSRVAGKSKEELQALVRAMVARRSQAA